MAKKPISDIKTMDKHKVSSLPKELAETMPDNYHGRPRGRSIRNTTTHIRMTEAVLAAIRKGAAAEGVKDGKPVSVPEFMRRAALLAAKKLAK